jgi:hypothetical protein
MPLPALREPCVRFNNAVVEAIKRLKPDLVVLNDLWAVNDAYVVPDPGLIHPEGTSNFQLGLEQTLQRIGAAGRSVCAVLDVPTYKYDVPRYLSMAPLRGLSTDVLQVSRAEALEQFERPQRDLRNLERAGKLTTVDPKDVLCRHETCALIAGGQVLYGDAYHLSQAGAMLVRSTLERCFAGAVSSSDRTQPGTDAGRPDSPPH